MIDLIKQHFIMAAVFFGWRFVSGPVFDRLQNMEFTNMEGDSKTSLSTKKYICTEKKMILYIDFIDL